MASFSLSIFAWISNTKIIQFLYKNFKNCQITYHENLIKIYNLSNLFELSTFSINLQLCKFVKFNLQKTNLFLDIGSPLSFCNHVLFRFLPLPSKNTYLHSLIKIGNSNEMLGVDHLMVTQNPSFNLRFIIPFREI